MKVWSPMCSTSTKLAAFSNIGTSMACPSPVFSRWNSAARMHCVAIRPTVWSIITIGTNFGSPKTRALQAATPDMPWMMES